MENKEIKEWLKWLEECISEDINDFAKEMKADLKWNIDEFKDKL